VKSIVEEGVCCIEDARRTARLRILFKDGESTKLGKRVERERLDKLAAAISEDVGTETHVAYRTEDSSS
jgi:hypothetical protein